MSEFENLSPEEEKKKKEEIPSADSGLGNLPPLSDFDTGEVSDLSSQLPPLSSFDSDAFKKAKGSDDFEGGLPPISDIDIVVPEPTGGNIKTTPTEFDKLGGSALGSLSTPSQPGTKKPSFQDLAADSDFSPETPEIGPGPISLESGLETPLGDSAFGGGSKGGVFDLKSAPPSETVATAPTQIIETPIFGSAQTPSPDFGSPAVGFGGVQSGGSSAPAGIEGLGTDIFGAPIGPGLETPIPEFTAGSGVAVTPPIAPTTSTQPPTDTGAPAAPAKKKKFKIPMAPIAAIIALIIGIIAGPFLSNYLPIPNPAKQEIAALENQLKQRDEIIHRYSDIHENAPGSKLNPEEVQKLQNELLDISNKIKSAQQELDGVNAKITERQSALQAVEADIAAKNEQYVSAQEAYDNLVNETEIIKARQTGLLAEIERLTNQVGQLEEANARSLAIKESFLLDIDKLIIQIKESLPLTPEKYSVHERLARAESLRQKAETSNWITPELQQEFTKLYQDEIEIGKRQEYFYAKINVKDSLGTPVNKWAECLMKGSWGVYYRTLDGKNIGVFQNIKPEAVTPVWGFQEGLPPNVVAQIEQEITSARPADFEQVVVKLAEKQLSSEPKSTVQKLYSSLQ
ncbi:MAG TPA: hypothetical protein PLA12_01840 [Candidatus Hydrogenedens sp.]|nr:hypothetical protein [Candidatus Hydrogenedens sp.]